MDAYKITLLGSLKLAKQGIIPVVFSNRIHRM